MQLVLMVSPRIGRDELLPLDIVGDASSTDASILTRVVPVVPPLGELNDLIRVYHPWLLVVVERLSLHVLIAVKHIQVARVHHARR